MSGYGQPKAPKPGPHNCAGNRARVVCSRCKHHMQQTLELVLDLEAFLS